MPHLIVEYSGNLPAFNIPITLRTLNADVAETLGNPEVDIKARAYRMDDYVVGVTNDPARAFVSLRLHTRSRDMSVLSRLADRLLTTLQTHILGAADQHVQYTVDILPIDPELYRKTVTPLPA